MSLAFKPDKRGHQQRSSESQSRIIQAASKAFTTRGYDDITTYEIAAAAGVAQGLIAYHFKSKEGVWRAAMDQVFGEFRNSLAYRIEDLRQENLRTFMQGLIRHIVTLEIRYPSRIRLMVESAHQSRGHLRWLVERHVRPIYGVMSHLLMVGQKHRVLRPLPVANAYYVLLTAGAVFSLGEEVNLVTNIDGKSNAFAEAQVRCLAEMLMVEPTTVD
jgi:TetR/AcrR family transcriptional regulator